MRTIALFATALLASACSEYDLMVPTDAQSGAVDETEDPSIGDDSQPTDAPVAVCSSNPDTVRPPFESNTFIGSDSYDPAGLAIVDWRWTLVTTPQGSTANLSGVGADVTFTADQAGTYIAELVVTTEDGRISEPCAAQLEAIPSEALWIEMFWENSGDDMDLHVLRPGGAPRTDGDCYFMNCDGGWAPDWGASGDRADDPTLDLDDISGTGPENINIGAPEFGTFTVFVHDYPGSSYTPENNVTVNIYVDGILAWTETRAIAGEDSDTYFAEIDWPTAQIRAL